MLRLSTTTNASGLDRANELVRNTPGALRETLETQSRPAIEALVHEQALLGEPDQATYFTFGSRASQRMYFHLLDVGAIPFVEIANGKRIYQRQGTLTDSWEVSFDARARGANGGLISIENRAVDQPGRHYPAFVYPRPPNSLSVYRQQPGFFGRWNFPYAYVIRRVMTIVSNDIKAALSKRLKG